MNIPRFAAEASLYKTTRQYTAVGAFGQRTSAVRMQLWFDPKNPGPQNLSGGEWICDQVCWDLCNHPSSGCFDPISRCCRHYEYFPGSTLSNITFAPTAPFKMPG
jgi:hypothetical protein